MAQPKPSQRAAPLMFFCFFTIYSAAYAAASAIHAKTLNYTKREV